MTFDGATRRVRQTGGQPMSLCLEDGLSNSMILLHVAMSLDGFIAGPGHDMSWTGGAEYDTSSELADEVARATGVVLAGRGWYEVASADEGGAVAGIYGGAWSGPVLVLTHHPERLASDPTVDAVSNLESGLARAEELADGRAVSIFGANVARQVLALGRLDEIIVQIVPLVLGDGVRLFGEAPAPRVRLERTYVSTRGRLTDMRFRVAGPPTSEFGLDAIDENRL
jgi:dihydrofolate reductase